MDSVELCFMPAVDLAAAIRAKPVSPVEVVDAVLARIERLNPSLNAYCTVAAEAARGAAKVAEAAVLAGKPLGPLHGVPVSVKDLVLTQGIRTTWGSAIHEHVVPEEDAPLVARLKAAGAIVLGKTNTPEYGWTAETDNRIFGPTRNPWGVTRSAGGSSGGAGPRWPRAWARWRWGPTGAAPSASPAPSAAWWGSSRPSGGSPSIPPARPRRSLTLDRWRAPCATRR